MSSIPESQAIPVPSSGKRNSLGGADSTAVDADFLAKDPENALIYATGTPPPGSLTGNYTPYRQGKMDDWSDEEKVEHAAFQHQRSVEDGGTVELVPDLSSVAGRRPSMDMRSAPRDAAAV